MAALLHHLGIIVLVVGVVFSRRAQLEVDSPDEPSGDEDFEIIQVADEDVEDQSSDTSHWVKRWEGKFQPKAQAVGKGEFGTAYVATVACNGMKVAVKQLRTASNSELEAEAAAMKPFTMPQFVQYFDHGEGEDGAKYILMEAAFGGNMAQIVDGRKFTSKNDKAQLMVDILTGLVDMHSRNVVHRAIKPANILVSNACGGSPPCHAKIADRGFACSIGSDLPGIPECQGVTGTPFYIAPEAYKAKLVDPKGDIWSLGLVYYELLFTEMPAMITASESIKELKENILNYKIDEDPNYLSMDPGPSQELLRGMLKKGYKKRYSAEKCLELAKQLLEEQSADVSGSLPQCWNTEPDIDLKTMMLSTPETNPTSTTESPADQAPEKDGDFVIIPNATSAIEANLIFNPGLVVPTTGTARATGKLKKLTKYMKRTKLKPGDTITEVNDLAWPTLTADQRHLLKSGLLGRDLFLRIVRA